MADEKTPLQEGETGIPAEASQEAAADAEQNTQQETAAPAEQPAAAEQSAPVPADTAADSDAVKNAADELDAVLNSLDTVPGDETDKAADASKPAETAAKPEKKPAPKKKKKRKTRKRTIEEELADLAEEEAQFDEWGRPIKKKRKRRKRKKGRGLSCTFVLLAAILALSSVLSMLILTVAKEIYGIGKSEEKKIVNIESGSSTQAIAEQLVAEHLITLPQAFRLVSRMNGKDGAYIAGEHVLTASMSYETMIEELCKNYKEEGRESVRVTIQEGWTLLRAAQELADNQVCNADKFIFFFNSGGYHFKFEDYLPERNPLKWQQMEGYCFPDTYEFYVNEDPSVVAQKIYSNFDSKLTDGDYAKMDELGMDLDTVITLASMVEGEASKKDYMRKVSAVFQNRLRENAIFPKLQSDPTRKYADDVIAANLDVNNETMITAYNTYKGNGLPPGAINNPGKDAIEAVLYPDPDTTIFYFNSNINTGETYFAHTLDEHNANLALVDAQYAAAEAAANGENVNG